MSSARAAPRVAFILKGYPRLSETFIAQEIRGLEARGLDIHIVSLRHPTDGKVHPVHEEIAAPVLYLPEYLHEEPLRVLRGWQRARRMAGYREAKRCWLADLRRDMTRNRIRRFGQACVLAAELPPGLGRLHAHFLHTPASVARYTSLLVGLPWSCSAHAKDVWTTPDWEIREKLASLDWLAICTGAGRDRLERLATDPARVRLIYHGVDLARFARPPIVRPPRDGTDPAAPVRILTIGRIVAKKGFDVLLAALARLPADLHWRLDHVGGGKRKTLLRQAKRLGIGGRITWHGGLAQGEVIARYRNADLFVLPCRIADSGDRDGLPNVLMEALSQELASISTNISGVPELIADGETGVLIKPEDVNSLASAIVRLARDPRERARLGSNGRRLIERSFRFEAGVDALASCFDIAVAARRRSGAAAGP